ncbi:hypothetical protein BHE74_00037427 [Ensete ventricosum]|nr:hypothetical protein GW17_00019011 [Ensete ventricosum]RWW55897.1 hypothetical protein BHE74_00037427 [Ensete ventricosum]RZS23685.1 hypothetical protein BHM03_00056655 [Ensete ventricosum]
MRTRFTTGLRVSGREHNTENVWPWARRNETTWSTFGCREGVLKRPPAFSCLKPRRLLPPSDLLSFSPLLLPFLLRETTRKTERDHPGGRDGNTIDSSGTADGVSDPVKERLAHRLFQFLIQVLPQR